MATFSSNYTFSLLQAFATKTIGTVERINRGWTNSMALKQGDVALDQLRLSEIGSSVTGTQNNLALDDQCSIFRWTGAANVTITGFTGGRSGRSFVVKHIGTVGTFMYFPHNSGSSTAANRVNCGSAGGQYIGFAGSALVWWDSTSSAWRLELIHPGYPIAYTPTAASATGTFTVTTTTAARFQQIGALLRVWHTIIGTNSAGSAWNELSLPTGGFVVTDTTYFEGRGIVNGGASTYDNLLAQCLSGSSAVRYFRGDPATSWAASTGNEIRASGELYCQ